MSGPVSKNDAPDIRLETDAAPGPVLAISPSREAKVGTSTVRRALPQRHRRTVGPWCFADHFGPTGPDHGLSIGPHPHNGLHTVVWQQQLDGIDVHQAVFISHTTERGELVRISSQFVADPTHPSLHFHRLAVAAQLWSVRVTRDYRAVGLVQGATITWFWIGDHKAFDRTFPS